MVELDINGKKRKLNVDEDMPLLWAVRENMGLTGTKYGCGQSLCGACTVLVEGEAIRSCAVSVSETIGKKIITIEGLDPYLKMPLQKAWIEEEVSQCGYCQPDIIMTTAAALSTKSTITDNDIDNALNGNICRCGTYPRIRRAIHKAAAIIRQRSST